MAGYRFRPATPQDRRQIRLLLRCFNQTKLRLDQPNLRPSWSASLRIPGLALLLSLGLQGLWGWGGLPLLGWGVLSGCALALACWLNLLVSDWQNYWVVECSQRLIACCKLTRSETHAVLADVVVAPDWRGQGVGAFLVRSIVVLMAGPMAGSMTGPTAGPVRFPGRLNCCSQPLPLYLACLPRLVPFYQQSGFRAVGLTQLPLQLRQELGLRTQPGLRAMVMAVEPISKDGFSERKLG